MYRAMKKSNIFSKSNVVLIKELVKTDFKLRYQGSLLGVAWSVLKPLMLFMVMYLVFVKFLKFTDGTPTYPIVLLLGISIWGFIAESTSVGMQSIVSRGDLLRKINFPKYIIIISSVASSLISLFINLAVVLVFAIFTGVNFTGLVLLVPISVLQLCLLVVGISLILSTLYVKYRDISHIWDVLLQIVFYSMPIIYPLVFVSKSYPIIAKLMMLNPAAQIIQDIRHNLIAPSTAPTVWNIIDNFWIAIIPVVLTFIIFIVGVVYFRKNSNKFAEIV